jgi:hypothetical protein
MDPGTTFTGVPGAGVTLPRTFAQAGHLQCDETICYQSSSLESHIPVNMNGTKVTAVASPILLVSLLSLQCLPGCLLLAYVVLKIERRFRFKSKREHAEPPPSAQTSEVILDRRLQTLCSQTSGHRLQTLRNQFNSQWDRTMRLIKEDQMAKERRAASAVECSCCFEQVPIDDMVACRDEGHLFCSTCLQTYVENQVFGNGNLGVSRETKELVLELECFHGDGCSSGFDGAFLEKALPSKVLGKLNEVQGQVNIEQAGLANVCKCPRCGFKAVLDPTQKVFSCPLDSCHFVSCRDCGEASHIPLPCEQVKKQTQGRLTVEEAMSAAIIRKCPSCSQEFVKSNGGCNKVRCGCGTEVCYVCRKAIQGYEHFCQTPHCRHKRCGKCRLWTKNDEDDARARREAGHAAARRARRYKFNFWVKKNTTALQIDVESILQEAR